jgi:hypothetical protein
VARWTLCWFLLIVSLTIAAYIGTNSLIAANTLERTEYAMLPVGQLGSATCTRATRSLVAAADGNAANSSTAQRDTYGRLASF